MITPSSRLSLLWAGRFGSAALVCEAETLVKLEMSLWPAVSKQMTRGSEGSSTRHCPCPHHLTQAVQRCPKSCCRSLGSCRQRSGGTWRGWDQLQGPRGWRLTVTDSSTSCPSRSQHHRWRGGDLKFALSIQPQGRLSSPLPALSPAVPVALCRRKPRAWCLRHFSCPALSRGAARRGLGAVCIIGGVLKNLEGSW